MFKSMRTCAIRCSTSDALMQLSVVCSIVRFQGANGLSNCILLFATRLIVFQLVIPKRIRLRALVYLLVLDVWVHFLVLFIFSEAIHTQSSYLH